jgi:exosortase/archaeosortase family protein
VHGVKSPNETRHKTISKGPRGPYRLLRAILALALIGACVVIVVNEMNYRSFEAALVSSWIQGLIPGGARPLGDHVLMYLPETNVPISGLGPEATTGPELIALHITIECASYVVVIPLLLISAFLFSATRVTWFRWALGTLAGVAGMLAVNQLRLGVIIFSTNRWGMDPGYEISHILVGSIIGLFGFIGCFFLCMKIMNPKRSFRRVRLDGRPSTAT